jgi:hypothetical protein
MAPSAGAAPVTVGDPLLGLIASTPPSGISATLINSIIAEPGALTTSPVNGVIVRWHLIKSTGGPFRLRVLRPAGGSYTAVGTSASAEAVTPGLETFATNLPIRAGDTIGLDVVEGLIVGAVPNPASVVAAISPILVEGATEPLTATGTGVEWAFNAEVQPTPSVTSIGPKSGSFKGGSSVRISGTDFAGVSGVSFGGVAAKSFTVNSETQLTAVAPTVKKPAAVDITVTTIAGTSAVVATDRFAYRACVVPKLRSKSLKAAKKKLKRADCRLGRVTKRRTVTPKTGKVIAQSKNAGKKLAPGTKLNLTLG